MLDAGIIENRQRIRDSDTVIAAQRRLICPNPFAIGLKAQTLFFHIQIAVRCFLAHHIQMSLQNDRLGVFHARRRRCKYNDVVVFVLYIAQTALFCEFHTEIANRLCVARAVRNCTQLLKNCKHTFRLQLIQNRHFDSTPFVVCSIIPRYEKKGKYLVCSIRSRCTAACRFPLHG